MEEIVKGPDLHFMVRPEGPAHDRGILREQFDENVYRLKTEDVASKVVADLGANIGAFSVHAASLGAKKVLAFEPEPNNWDMLLTNLTLNKVSGTVVPRKVAIGDHAGKYLITDDAGGSFITSSYEGPLRASECLAITLDEALEAEEYVDIMKLDVERSEYGILLGASPETMGKIGAIVMEFHTIDAMTYDRLIRYLEQFFILDIIGHHSRGGLLFGRAKDGRS